MSMNLKTHSAYSELFVDEVFDWTLADKSGRVADPQEAPKDADITVVHLWGAKVFGQPAETFDSFITKHVGPDAVSTINAIAAAKDVSQADHRKAVNDAIDLAVASGGDREALNPTVLESFNGKADSRKQAIQAAKISIEVIADNYLLPSEPETTEGAE